MHLKKIITSLVRVFKPDKALYRDIAEDFRKVGVIWIGGSLATFLLHSVGIALIVLSGGITIWMFGIFITSKAIAQEKENG